ncbi:MAG: hypothetical protein GF411_09510 [Candidatus Lokiarchaeota archaeon]|nr:hypothetical protein [Candidatus Lokiarchaeota archaeon]
MVSDDISHTALRQVIVERKSGEVIHSIVCKGKSFDPDLFLSLIVALRAYYGKTLKLIKWEPQGKWDK